MLDTKIIADLITVARGLLGIWIAWFGLTQNVEALPVVIPLMILCWTGDFVDGGLAHRSRHPRRTWIGDRDIQVDLFVSLCLGVYLIGAGFVSLAFGCFYLFVWTVVFLLVGQEHNLLMLMQAPIYLYFILVAVRIAPQGGYLLVVWALVATAINWKRFSHTIVPKFIEGMRSLVNGHGKPRHS